MYELVNRPLAEADLRKIWRDTYEDWGQAQADKYLREIGAALQSLKDNPRMGRERDEIREGYRSLVVRQHLIFYVIQDRKISVRRILHGRMDPDRHL